jgi:hypothetical protein
MSIINTKQINSPLNITGSLFGTSSWAEYVVNGGSGAGFPYTGNAVISGSLLVSGSGITVTGSLSSANITGSLRGTASFATTASHALNGGVTAITAGTGISRNVATGNVTITNTAPDQVVSLGSGTGISVSGTYPSFTITNTLPGIAPDWDAYYNVAIDDYFSEDLLQDVYDVVIIKDTFNNITLDRLGRGIYRLTCAQAIFKGDATFVTITVGMRVYDNPAVGILVPNSTTQCYVYIIDPATKNPIGDDISQTMIEIKTHN